MERGSIWRPNVEISPSCPRCASSNTKFCYYNNYSLTQPRYFCKGCRRYWTKGGSLRNVPVGGGCRKSRRGKSSNGNNSKSGKNFSNGYDVVLKNRGGSSNSSGSNIDLALVYANFLNPAQPDNNSKLELTRGDDHNSSEFLNTQSTNVAVDSSGDGLLLQVEIPRSSSIAGWSTDIINDHQILYNSGFDSVNNKNQEHIQECYISHGLSNYVLPPLPGEEGVSIINHHETFVWSDSPLMENHHAPVQPVQEPVHFGDEADDPTNLLFGNWSPFDFSSDGTFSRT